MFIRRRALIILGAVLVNGVSISSNATSKKANAALAFTSSTLTHETKLDKRRKIVHTKTADLLQPEETRSLGGSKLKQALLLCTCLCSVVGTSRVVFAQRRKDPDTQSSRAFQLCVAWYSLTVAMQVLNKYLVTELESPAIVSVVQMWMAMVAMGIPCYRQLLEATRKQLLAWTIVPVLFAAMLFSSFYTYEYVSLSFYAVVRSLTPLVVLPVERTIMPVSERPRVSNLVILSLAIMLAGAAMYGQGTGSSVSALGALLAAPSALLAVCDRLLQRRLLTSECRGLPSATCAVMNNALGSLPALLLAGLTHEFSTAFAPERLAAWADPYVVCLLGLSGAAGMGICYLAVECQRALSATSFLVLQNFEKMAVVACGILLFDGPAATPLASAGLLCCLGGGCLYGRAQMILQEQLRLRPNAADAHDLDQ
mmetsp:Transcript_13524/g.38313  ORF Transcript_13524/g.38313 Transcript_13524/m.38313 type:complete len:426 (-) Transcript_13524:82-1359(-)